MFNIWLVHFAWPARRAFATETMNSSLHAILSVAYKEFLHIYRDKRVLLLLLILPPLFILLFGYAFESSDITDVPGLLVNRDNTPRTQRFIDVVSQSKTFQWRQGPPDTANESDLLAHHVQAALIVPPGWSDSLNAGNPKPLTLYLDGSDINTADAAEGAVQKSLADFQMKERDLVVEDLPDEVIELGKQLPVQIRKQFVSLMEAWSAKRIVLYNPKERFIDYVIPGIIGLILQLLTVTLMACTIARERESGTLYQLMVTSLEARRNRDRKNPAIPRSLDCNHRGDHVRGRLSFSRAILSTTRPHADLFAVFALFTRTRTADLRFLQNPDPGDSIFRLLFTAGLCLVRRIRPARATTPSHPVSLGSFSAHTFLPRVQSGEHVSSRTRILPGQSHRAIRGRGGHLHRRGVSAPKDRGVTRVVGLTG
jgi:hypothetical protein